MLLGSSAVCAPALHLFLGALAGGPACFARAIQSADLALKVITGAAALGTAWALLVAGIIEAIGRVTPVSAPLAAR